MQQTSLRDHVPRQLLITLFVELPACQCCIYGNIQSSSVAGLPGPKKLSPPTSWRAGAVHFFWPTGLGGGVALSFGISATVSKPFASLLLTGRCAKQGEEELLLLSTSAPTRNAEPAAPAQGRKSFEAETYQLGLQSQLLTPGFLSHFDSRPDA